MRVEALQHQLARERSISRQARERADALEKENVKLKAELAAKAKAAEAQPSASAAPAASSIAQSISDSAIASLWALNAALEQALKSICAGATSDVIQMDLRHLKRQIAAAFVANNAAIPEWVFSVSIPE